MASRIEVNNHEEAWDVAKEIFPAEYKEDTDASLRAGYPTYRSTVEYYDYICDLDDRLELNFKNGRSINIWITGDNKDKKIAELEAQVKQLQKELDKELEWKNDESSGTRMSQKDYKKLTEVLDTDILSDEDAEKMISNTFGFDVSRIKIVHEAQSFEVNRHQEMRAKETYRRDPAYNASDWNYIRFDCAFWFYEMINGQLYQYYC